MEGIFVENNAITNKKLSPKQKRQKLMKKDKTFSLDVENSPQITLKKPDNLFISESTKETVPSPMINVIGKNNSYPQAERPIKKMEPIKEAAEEEDSKGKSSKSSLNRKNKEAKKIQKLNLNLKKYEEDYQTHEKVKENEKKTEKIEKTNIINELLDESFPSSVSDMEGGNIKNTEKKQEEAKFSEKKKSQKKPLEVLEDNNSSSSEDDGSEESFMEESLGKRETNVIKTPHQAILNSNESVCKSLGKNHIDEFREKEEEKLQDGDKKFPTTTSVSFIHLSKENNLKNTILKEKSLSKMKSVNDSNLSVFSPSSEMTFGEIFTPKQGKTKDKKSYTFNLEDYERSKEKNKKKEKKKTCSICELEFCETQMMACFAICEHIFHEQCLFELIESDEYQEERTLKEDAIQEKSHVFCPLCKQLE